jgi:hypothetical protein
MSRRKASSPFDIQKIDYKVRLLLLLFWITFLVFNSMTIAFYITDPKIVSLYLLTLAISVIAFTVFIIFFIYLVSRFGIKKVMFA